MNQCHACSRGREVSQAGLKIMGICTQNLWAALQLGLQVALHSLVSNLVRSQCRLSAESDRLGAVQDPTSLHTRKRWQCSAGSTITKDWQNYGLQCTASHSSSLHYYKDLKSIRAHCSRDTRLVCNKHDKKRLGRLWRRSQYTSIYLWYNPRWHLALHSVETRTSMRCIVPSYQNSEICWSRLSSWW